MRSSADIGPGRLPCLYTYRHASKQCHVMLYISPSKNKWLTPTSQTEVCNLGQQACNSPKSMCGDFELHSARKDITVQGHLLYIGFPGSARPAVAVVSAQDSVHTAEQ